jgi:hypothetical protein
MELVLLVLVIVAGRLVAVWLLFGCCFVAVWLLFGCSLVAVWLLVGPWGRGVR